MIKIAIIGGKLQGVEAVYLASKAGMETVVIDKRDDVPAKNICSRFICSDIINRNSEMIEELKKADFVLPALENEEVLNVLNELAKEHGFILAFDLNAYKVSSSKLLSDKLFYDNDVPAPRYYPNCKSPYIAKPSNASGSEGVKYIENADSMEDFLKNVPACEKWVAQEFLNGKSYSIEVIGVPGNYSTYEITEIIIDEVYDCKRVLAPCNISNEMRVQFSNIGVRLAELLQLHGIMDVEVIDDEGILKVLEIDARFPSQTPTVVYHSSGVNFIEEIRNVFCGTHNKNNYSKRKKFVCYEHLLINEEKIRVLGEHIMGEAGPLKLMHDFCGADEVLTDYKAENKNWRGTFINIADSEEELNEKRVEMLNKINLLQGEKLEYFDLSPSYKNV